MKLQGGEVQMSLWLINTTDDPLFYSLLYFFFFQFQILSEGIGVLTSQWTLSLFKTSLTPILSNCHVVVTLWRPFCNRSLIFFLLLQALVEPFVVDLLIIE